MTILRRHPLHWAAILAGVILSAAPAAAKAAAGRDEEKAPEKAATKPPPKKLTYKVKQPAEFVALAEKARKLKGVYAKGTGEMTGGEEIPPEQRRMTFETWTTPTSAKAVFTAGERTQTVVYDGTYAYVFRQRPDREGRGSRKKVTQEKYYDDLMMASPYCDAARGYVYLANAGTFKPIPPDDEYGRKVPGLKWFQVVPAATAPERAFLRRMATFKLGLSTADGLIRVMLMERSRRKEPDGDVIRMQMAITFAPVRHEAVKPDDLKLPPEAAQAEWRDRDKAEKMEPPKAVIAPGKPKKEGKAPARDEGRKDK